MSRKFCCILDWGVSMCNMEVGSLTTRFLITLQIYVNTKRQVSYTCSNVPWETVSPRKIKRTLFLPLRLLLHIDLRPSRQSRNWCIQSKISRYNLDRGPVEFCANATITGSRWTTNNYITQCHREFELGWSGSWSSSCSSKQWDPAPIRGLGPQDLRLSSPAELERSAPIVRGTGGQYVAFCSVSNSPLTHNPFSTLLQPFRIKCERYIFLKKFVRSSLLLILFPHVYYYAP